MATSTGSKNISRADLIKRREQLDAERSRLDADLLLEHRPILKPW